MTPDGGGTELRRSLGPLTLWGLGVGYVISGMYFGWNLGLPAGGTHGLLAATALAGWRHVVYPAGSSAPSDSPLPLALRAVVGAEHPMYHLLVVIGLFGLVASFHGLVLVAGRATFEMGRMGYLPRRLGRVLPSRGTPAAALLANMAVGLIALSTGRTAEIIVIAVFGALTMYAVSMGAFFRLRRKEPFLARPFRTPLVPLVPAVALVLSVACLAALFWYNPGLGLVYLAVLAAGVAWFRVVVRPGLAR